MNRTEKIADAVVVVQRQRNECLHIHMNTIVGNAALLWLIYRLRKSGRA
jgi:hypothetical protein